MSAKTIFTVGDQIDWSDKNGEGIRLFGSGPYTVTKVSDLPIEEPCECDESKIRPHLKGEHYKHSQLVFARKIQDTRFVKGQTVLIYGRGHEFRKCTVH